MTVNLRELHRRTGAVIDLATKGDIITIERRGVVVAEIHPARPSGVGFPAGHWEALKRFPQFTDDIGSYISEDRDRN